MGSLKFSVKDNYRKFKKLKEFLGPEIMLLCVCAIVLGFVWFGIEASFIFVIQGFLKALGVLTKETALLPSFFPEDPFVSVFLLLALGILRSVVYGVKNYVSGITSQAFIRIQREKILDSGLGNAQNLTGHEVLSLFSDRITDAGQTLFQGSKFINITVSTMLLVLAGLRLAPQQLIVGMLLLGLAMVPFRYVSGRLQKAGGGLFKEWKLINQTLVQGFRNHFLLKIYGLIDSEIERGNHALRGYYEHYKTYYFLSSLKAAFPMMAGVTVISVITWTSVHSGNTSGAILLSFFYVFVRIAQGLSEASHCLSIINFYAPGFRAIYRFHEDQKTFQTHLLTGGPAPIQQSLGLSEKGSAEKLVLDGRNLKFSYPGGRTLFENLSFTISTGQVLLVRGPSGSGKSTLLTIILGLHQAQSGGVFINGINSQNCRDSLYQHIGYVGPDPYMIPGTVRTNLLYGLNPKLIDAANLDDQMWTALNRAQLAPDIKKLKGGLDEVLSEMTQLSTGQKQRLAIARALLRRPKLLILDEATANLDPVTEQKFISEIKPLLSETATVVISHKDSFNSVATTTILLGGDLPAETTADFTMANAIHDKV